MVSIENEGAELCLLDELSHDCDMNLNNPEVDETTAPVGNQEIANDEMTASKDVRVEEAPEQLQESSRNKALGGVTPICKVQNQRQKVHRLQRIYKPRHEHPGVVKEG